MKTFLLFATLLLSGCATYNEDFDCEPGRGVGCQSLSSVNQMVNEGKLPLERVSLETETQDTKPAEPLPRITSQKVIRVWVAGYTDEEGVTHDSSFLYVPLNQSA